MSLPCIDSSAFIKSILEPQYWFGMMLVGKSSCCGWSRPLFQPHPLGGHGVPSHAFADRNLRANQYNGMALSSFSINCAASCIHNPSKIAFSPTQHLSNHFDEIQLMGSDTALCRILTASAPKLHLYLIGVVHYRA